MSLLPSGAILFGYVSIKAVVGVCFSSFGYKFQGYGIDGLKSGFGLATGSLVVVFVGSLFLIILIVVVHPSSTKCVGSGSHCARAS
jgi:uncharacterized membrane protein